MQKFEKFSHVANQIFWLEIWLKTIKLLEFCKKKSCQKQNTFPWKPTKSSFEFPSVKTFSVTYSGHSELKELRPTLNNNIEERVSILALKYAAEEKILGKAHITSGTKKAFVCPVNMPLKFGHPIMIAVE
jgi:hypothetical protein